MTEDDRDTLSPPPHDTEPSGPPSEPSLPPGYRPTVSSLPGDRSKEELLLAEMVNLREAIDGYRETVAKHTGKVETLTGIASKCYSEVMRLSKPISELQRAVRRIESKLDLEPLLPLPDPNGDSHGG